MKIKFTPKRTTISVQKYTYIYFTYKILDLKFFFGNFWLQSLPMSRVNLPMNSEIVWTNTKLLYSKRHNSISFEMPPGVQSVTTFFSVWVSFEMNCNVICPRIIIMHSFEGPHSVQSVKLHLSKFHENIKKEQVRALQGHTRVFRWVRYHPLLSFNFIILARMVCIYVTAIWSWVWVEAELKLRLRLS